MLKLTQNFIFKLILLKAKKHLKDSRKKIQIYYIDKTKKLIKIKIENYLLTKPFSPCFPQQIFIFFYTTNITSKLHFLLYCFTKTVRKISHETLSKKICLLYSVFIFDSDFRSQFLICLYTDFIGLLGC